MASGRPLYEPDVLSRVARHQYEIERLKRRAAPNPAGIGFNLDNEGGWLYAATNDPLVLGTDVPALTGDPISTPSAEDTWGGVLLDKTGRGLLLVVDDPEGSYLGGVAFQVTTVAHDGFPATAGWMNLADEHLEISLKRAGGEQEYLWANPDYFQFTFSPSGSALYVDAGSFAVFLPHSGLSLDDVDANFALKVDSTFHIEVASGDLSLHAKTGRNILMTSLPTSDPGVSGALWISAGTLKVSP